MLRSLGYSHCPAQVLLSVTAQHAAADVTAAQPLNGMSGRLVQCAEDLIMCRLRKRCVRAWMTHEWRHGAFGRVSYNSND